MRVPLSWLKDFVEINIPAELLAERLTLAGLEVKGIEYIGVPQGEAPEGITVPPSDHLVWDRDKLVLGAIREVKAHPNADKLVLAMVDYGGEALEQVVTGAPNLFAYKGQGLLNTPLLTPFAKEGATVYDGHAQGRQKMVLKEKALRGIPNKCMVCSAKELGISEEHEGIMLLEADSLASSKPGTPMVDLLGDVILEIDLTPNLARAYGIMGVAREVAALTEQTMREPDYGLQFAEIAPNSTWLALEIRNAKLNPRFYGLLIRDVQIRPSPQWLSRRLEAVGTRSINNIVDITNYIMFEIGQPLHAFDYEVLVRRAESVGQKTPKIITRNAAEGEKLTTLDGVARTFDSEAILVCDEAGVLSIGAIMGGAESEIRPDTRHVFLEGANWNFINIRRTMTLQKMTTEAGLRFSRGVHPALAERGVRRAAELMRKLGAGKIAPTPLDLYPLPAPVVRVDLPLSEVERLIGLPLTAAQVTAILSRLQFKISAVSDSVLRVEVPDHRVDIGEQAIGIADIVEEIARIYGYDRIPNTLIADMLPPQANNDELLREDRVRDLLADAGLREVINYRLTTPEAEAKLTATGAASGWPALPYVRLANPISAERTALRQTLLHTMLENVAANARHSKQQKLFEIGSVFLPHEGEPLPREPRRLSLVLVGPRQLPSWSDTESVSKGEIDFFDLKGVLEGLGRGLRLPAGALSFAASQHGTFYPGRTATILLRGKAIGTLGELHPLVAESYGLGGTVAAAELEIEALVANLPLVDRILPVPTQPAVYQDLALVVDDKQAAAAVEAVIRKAGGALLRDVALFDVYRGGQLASGKKSLAYALTFRADDRTLTDADVAKLREKILKAAERELGAVLRA
jgi:phenylalanyl-tRNA synthetase beta chain